jgi:hypothetical protein
MVTRAAMATELQSSTTPPVRIAAVTHWPATVSQTWPGVDLLVVDAEGFEVQVLRGASAVLPRTRALYVEFASEQLAEQGCSVAQFAALVGAAFSVVHAVRGTRVERIGDSLADYLARHSARGTRFDLLATREPLASC